MEKKVVASRLGRMARLAALGVRTGAGMVLGRSDEAAADEAAAVLARLDVEVEYVRAEAELIPRD